MHMCIYKRYFLDFKLQQYDRHVPQQQQCESAENAKHGFCSKKNPMLSYIELQSSGLAVRALKQIAKLTSNPSFSLP